MLSNTKIAQVTPVHGICTVLTPHTERLMYLHTYFCSMQSISHTLRYSLKVYAVIIPHIKRLLQLDSIHSIHVVIPCKQFHPCMGSCCIIQSLIIHALKDFCTYTKTLVTVWNYRPLNVIFLKSDSHVHRQFCRFGLLCTGMQESII